MSTIIFHDHHIIPEYAGGTNDKSNLIRVNVKLHAFLHYLLYREHGNEEDLIACRGLLGLETSEGSQYAAMILGGKHSYQKNLLGLQNIRKNKTYEEIYGAEKAEKIKRKMRGKKRQGANNPCARTYLITHPSGKVETIKSLKTWCESKGLKYNSFHKATIVKKSSFKGYTACLKENQQEHSAEENYIEKISPKGTVLSSSI